MHVHYSKHVPTYLCMMCMYDVHVCKMRVCICDASRRILVCVCMHVCVYMCAYINVACVCKARVLEVVVTVSMCAKRIYPASVV
jgi:hypothetical protein